MAHTAPARALRRAPAPDSARPAIAPAPARAGTRARAAPLATTLFLALALALAAPAACAARALLATAASAGSASPTTMRALLAASDSPAKTAPGLPVAVAHPSLTPVERKYTNMVLRLLTDETPEDGASVIVGMLQTYAWPTSAPGCLVDSAVAKRYRKLPTPSGLKWATMLHQIKVCRAGAAGAAAPCIQAALDAFGLGTAEAQRDLTQLFYCSMICEREDHETCEGGKDCNTVLQFNGCVKAPPMRKATVAGVALSGGKGAAGSQSYYLMDSGK